MSIYSVNYNNFLISTDKQFLDIPLIHDFLANRSYWAANIPIETVKTSIENALTFGVYFQGKQVGFARVISDFATIAYLGDVFIIEEFRGQGLSKWLIESIHQHPQLQGLRRWILLTGDAHGLYQQFGWTPIASPDKWMEKHTPNLYKKPQR